MNIIIYAKNSDEIIHFVEDCIQQEMNFIGNRARVLGVEESVHDIRWTEDTTAPVFNPVTGEQIGWDKTVSQITESSISGVAFKKTTNEQHRRALEKLNDLAGFSYIQLDTYIDNHVTNLSEAKTYLKKLSKVVLALIKISMRK